MLKIYLKVVALIVIFLILGLVIPSLISAKDDSLVIGGGVLLVAIPVILFAFVKSFFKDIRNLMNKVEEPITASESK